MNFQLSLTEYSAKYKVSISTLRRRIKKGEIAFIQESGKYMLPDVSFDDLLAHDIAPPSTVMISQTERVASPQEMTPLKPSVGHLLEPIGLDLSFDDEDVQSTALATIQNKPAETALTELKKAYTLVLGEKEEQILQLKQHIVDLQTLNKALENEVGRLTENNKVPSKTSFTKYDF